MAPKGKKIPLNEFLGSWADEMDALPSGPAARSEEDQARGNDRFSNRRDDFHSSRPERSMAPPRDDVPLPTRPPYTAFIGNMPFDLAESNLVTFFAPLKTKSIKIIKDRDEKPKGFGYVEFEDLQGLKEALEKTGSSLLGRTIRVSVAEPPKERHAADDDSKFEGSWRRDGPLPDNKDSRDQPRRRHDAAPHAPSMSDDKDDWRSNRPVRASAPEAEAAPYRKKSSGFPTQEASQADKEEVWTIGGKFKPSAPEEAPSSRFSSARKQEPPKTDTDEGDWRSRRRASPGNSTPPTPQVTTRRKLDLLPRTGTGSGTPSPLSSPKMGPSPTHVSKPSPFGAARPVDVTQREREVGDRIEREREAVRDKVTMSRTSSKTATERPRPRTPPPSGSAPSTPSSPKSHQPKAIPANLAANIRPSVSFANAAAAAKLAEKEADGQAEIST